MKRRFWSVCLALALCWTVLPATALAADVAPNELWVGGTNVVQGGYWTTNADGSLTASDNSHYNVYYDGNGNLWLDNANIVGQGVGTLDNHGFTGIYAYYTEQTETDIALTIHLTGDNSVSNGYPIYVAPWGGSASLTITGPGSLTATGTVGGNGGIFVRGDTSSLTIENGADVTVNSARSSAVTIVAHNEGTGTLTVDNATLRAYGYVIDDPDDPYGICFSYRGSSSNIVDGSRALRVSGNSIIHTNYMQATYSELYISAATESGGIVFDGSEGTVYGDVALQEDLTIGADETLTIPATASLTIPSGVTLTNNGTVTNGGTLTNSGTIDNYGNVTGNGITGTPINHKVTDVSLDKTSLALDVGGTAQLTATVQPEEATNKNVTWTSGAPTVATVDNTGKVTAHSAGTAAITVTTADGAHTAQCTVTVTAPVTPEEPVTPPSDDSEPTYSPSLDVGDGGTVQVNPRTPEAGEEVTLTVTPDEGYAVEEVSVTDRDGDEVEVTDNGDGTYTFEQPRGRVTIEVTFRETVPAMPFADVPEDHWARDAIAWAYENGYVSGTSAAAFSPGASISRQQVWMILARLSGGAPADMAAARAWAVESGISDGTAPGGAVTRQQLAALLFRFAQSQGMDVSVGEDTNILSYPDAFDAAEYAVPALQWACGAGVLYGTSDGRLDPQGTATRAQFAVMLERFWR